MTARPDSGFSLLEVVVAIAVFSLGALAVMNVLGVSSRNATADEARIVAGIVAENRIAEVMAYARAPAQGASNGTEHAMARDWDWEMQVGPSPEPRILRIDVRVRQSGGTQVLSEFTSFRAAQ
jgi:general secretion pathway protein I